MQRRLKQVVGFQIFAELYACNKEKISKTDTVRDILIDAVKQSELKIIKHYFHQFSPTGVTGVIMLKESHVSIHTWPEFKYAAVDIFVCGAKHKALKALDLMKSSFESKEFYIKKFERG